MALGDEKGGGFRFYSLGIVVFDKEEGSDIIEVCPIEEFPLELGDLGEKRTRTAKVTGTNNVSKTNEIEGRTTIRAKWVPLSNPNRDNSPDVYRSETVKLYKYADTQDYYWTTIFREPSLRGRERVRISLSNQDPGTPYNDDTSYWVEFDTRHKSVQIHTSSNDGEPTAYDIKIDTKEGIVHLKDELSNEIMLQSVSGFLRFDIRERTEFNTPNFVINSETYELNAKSRATVNTPDHTMNADESTINGKEHTVNGEQCTMNTLLKGTEGFDLKGGTGSSTAKMVGNLEVDGSIHATGSITDEGGNTNHHSH